MCHSPKHRIRRGPAVARGWWLIFTATGILICLGCGSGAQDTALDPLSLFADHQTGAARHHPYDLVELELGEFDVAITIPESVDQYRIGFKAAAIVPITTADKLKPRFAEYDTRIRDMILASAQMLSPNNITDPHQAWLKSEIIANLSKMLKTRDVRDVVFSNYNFERR
jgi:hypothetical protein